MWDRLVADGADLGSAPGRLLRHQRPAARQGLPRVRRGARPGPHPRRGRPDLHLRPVRRPSLRRPRGGRAAARATARPGGSRRSSSTTRDAVLWGGELLLRDGRPVGQVTSAAPSATLGATVGLTWVWQRDGGPVPRRGAVRGRLRGRRRRHTASGAALARARRTTPRTRTCTTDATAVAGLECAHGSRGCASWCPETGRRGATNALQALGVAGGGLLAVTVMTILAGGPAELDTDGTGSIRGVDERRPRAATGVPGPRPRDRPRSVHGATASIWSTAPARRPAADRARRPTDDAPARPRPRPRPRRPRPRPRTHPEPESPTPPPGTPTPTPEPTTPPADPDGAATEPDPVEHPDPRATLRPRAHRPGAASPAAPQPPTKPAAGRSAPRPAR